MFDSGYSNDNLAEKFAEHEYFLPTDGNLTGKRLQTETFFGRMLSVTVWPTENRNNFFGGAARMSPGAHIKAVETMSEKFYSFYEGFVTFMKKLLKNKATKNKVLEWFRLLINLNTDYFKMMPQFANLTPKSVFLNALAIFLELSAPFVSKLEKFQDNFRKINPLYCATEKYLNLGNCDKINSHQIEETKVDDDQEFNFITECFFITHTIIKIAYKKVIKQYNQACEQAQAAGSSMNIPELDAALNQVFCMEVHLFAKEYKAKLFQFLAFSSYYFCFTSSQIGEEEEKVDFTWYAEKIQIEDNDYLKPEMCHIPDFFAENISKLGMMYRVFAPHTFEKSLSFDSIMLF